MPNNLNNDELYEWDDENDPNMDNDCPNCKQEYDNIDYEYQICSICGYDNHKTK